MGPFDPGALLLAFTLTLIEMTEVVVLVFALRTEEGSIRTGALGALAGAAVVAGVATGTGELLLRLPTSGLLGGASVALFAFGYFLFRSTLRSYRRTRGAPASPSSQTSTQAVHFGGGFTVGAVETTEAVIVLLSLAAAGQGTSAVVGACVAVAALAAATAVLHERIRRIKVPQLKLAGTGMLFAFAVFYAGEALRFGWPLGDVSLVPLFAAGVGTAWILLQWRIRVPTVPEGAKG